MSHVVTVKTKIRDAAAVAAACRRVGILDAVQGTAELFSGNAEGTVVHLPGWRYPVVFDLATGEVRYDNYNGAWGAQAELDKFLQAYAVEKAKAEARRAGHTVTELALEDGSVRLSIVQA
jgi:hypothetical protein